jgi:hypothetical protein
MTDGRNVRADLVPRIEALSAVVVSEEVVILIAGGQKLRLSATAAEVSGWRLLDAAAIAQGRLPDART